MTNRVGQQLGNYRLVRFLGAGGFAEVYLGEHVLLGTPAAIKILDARLQQQEAVLFQEEARRLAPLIHPHIIRLLEFGIEGNTPFMVMDYAPNGTLKDRHPKGTQLALPTVVSYVKQIGEALQFAHDNKIIHRDIKPANILKGSHNEILLSDFGIAVISHSTNTQKTEDQLGTPAYIAPEQIKQHPTPASDQYALGVMVYQWLCGNLPFEGTKVEVYLKHLTIPPPPLHATIPTISPSIEEVVLKALAKDPKKRFASVQEFATNLEKAYKSLDSTPPQPPPRPIDRISLLIRKPLFILTVVLVFALIISSIVLLPQGGSIISMFHSKTSSPAIISTRSPITPTPSQGTKSIPPTPDILLTAEAARPVNQDALTSSSSPTQKAFWQSVGTLNSQCFFASDGYHVRITEFREAICHERTKFWQDFVITVDMTLHGSGSGGLLFRDQDIIGGNGAYFFEVDTKGYYKISIISSTNKVLQWWMFSLAIHRGTNVRNTLQVIASGDILLFFINGTYLTPIKDDTFSYGGISLACFKTGEAIFSNLYVYPYSSSP